MHIVFEVVQVGWQGLNEHATLQGHKAGLPVPVTICDRSCGHMCQMPLSQHLLIKVCLVCTLTTCYLLPTTYYLLLTTYYLLLTTCYLLLATCYLLSSRPTHMRTRALYLPRTALRATH